MVTGNRRVDHSTGSTHGLTNIGGIIVSRSGVLKSRAHFMMQGAAAVDHQAGVEHQAVNPAAVLILATAVVLLVGPLQSVFPRA